MSTKEPLDFWETVGAVIVGNAIFFSAVIVGTLLAILTPPW